MVFGAWLVLLIISLGIVVAAAFLFRALAEEPVQYVQSTSSASLSDPARYKIVVESFESETGLAQATMSLQLSRAVLLSQQSEALLRKDIPDLPELHGGTGVLTFKTGMSPSEYEKELLSYAGAPWDLPPELKLLFTPQQLVDISPLFQGFGLLAVQLPSLRPASPVSPANLSTDFPSPHRAQLRALGDPRRYPFDRYLVMGQIQGVAYLGYKGRYALINGETYQITFRLPGYVVKPAHPSLLRDWPTLMRNVIWKLIGKLEPFKRVKFHGGNYDPERWKRGQFVFVLERPAFLKVATVLLGIIALVSIAPVVWLTDPRQLLLNAVAYFLALWALRSVLSTGAPKIPTWVDYGAVFLYLAELAAVALTVAVRRAF